MNKIKSAILIGASSLVMATSSSAALITHDFVGGFTTINDLTAYSELDGMFSLSSTVSGSVTYDDALLTGNLGETISAVSYTLTIGGITYSEMDDVIYSGPGTAPDVSFVDGVLQDVLFITESAQTDSAGEVLWDMATEGNTFSYYDITTANFGLLAEGYLNYYPTPPAVPVPAAVWLFGSGLIGLVGVARRKSVA